MNSREDMQIILVKEQIYLSQMRVGLTTNCHTLATVSVATLGIAV